MIKEEQFEGKVVFYCLNPFCTDSNNRKFENADRHFERQQCKKWIVDRETLAERVSEPLHVKTINNIMIDFVNRPIEAFKTLRRLDISDWRKVLSSEEAKVKKEVCRAIDVEFETLRTKIEQIISSSHFFNRVSNIALYELQPSPHINQYFDENLQQLSSLKSKVLFKRLELKQQISEIKQQIQKIYESIIEDQVNAGDILTHKEQRDFHSYIFQTTNEFFAKVQEISLALRKKAMQYSMENERCSLECALCERRVSFPINPSIKNSVKKKVAGQLLFHFYCQHYEEVGFSYSRKIAKTYLMTLKFQEFVSLSKRYTHITIVDRQSGVVFEQKFEQAKTGILNFTVQIVSDKNQAMARGKHILVRNHQSIDSLIAIISYICTQRDQNVEIVSNKPSLKRGIEDLLELKGSRSQKLQQSK